METADIAAAQKKKIAVAFNPLDLQFKPNPKKKEENVVKVAIAPAAAAVPRERAEKDGDEESKGDESEGKDEESEGEEDKKTLPPPPKIEVIDKRADANINRRFILENLQRYNVAAAAAAAASLPKKVETISAAEETAAAAAPTTEPAAAAEAPKKMIKIVKKGKTVPIEVAPTTAAEEPEMETEAEAPALKPRAKPGRKTAAPPTVAAVKDIGKIVIGDTILGERLPAKKEAAIHRIPKYYMNNRKLFLQSMNKLLLPYKDEIDDPDAEGAITCDRPATQAMGLLAHQKVVRDYLNLYTPYRGLLLYHSLGSGKCHAKGTPIMLYDGTIKPVEEIKVGDLLMGDDSKPRTVLSLARGEDEMYDIIPIKGDKYTVNQCHILCLKASSYPKIRHNTHKANTNFNIQWIENNQFQSKTFSYNPNNQIHQESQKIAAEKFYKEITTNEKTKNNILEIEVNDYLKLPKNLKSYMKGYKVPIEFPEKEVPIDPYMIGYWLGDGTSSDSDITTQDSTVLYYFAKNLQKYKLSLHYCNGYTYKIQGSGKRSETNIFYKTIKDLNMFKNKHIPHLYKCNSRENRLKLLAGIIDSDGCYSRGCFEFTNKNEKLMDDVIYLARSLGFSCYKREKKTTWTYKGIKNFGKAWRITISGEGIENIPTQIPRKKASPRNQVKDVLVSGIEVKHAGRGDYYGFTLDGNCRYLLGDTTVTHNTCSSIAIAEGMKSQKQIYIMTPASLRMNYFSEMKKCGDDLYKRTQFWEFVSTTGHPEYVAVLSTALSLPAEYIERKRGAWLVNVTKTEENFSRMDASDQKSIDEQLDAMIQTKYIGINYNGLNRNRMETLTQNGAINPFDNSVVVVDEAHNFVSRIVNKLNNKKSIPYQLYQYLMDAQNARIVFLSGTPIINYPNEISVLFNILRGYINTWTIPIKDPAGRKVSENTFITLFAKENLKTYDYVAYSGNTLTITRNPFGFSNTKKAGKIPANVKEDEQAFYKYDGLTMDENNRMTDDAFIARVVAILRKHEFQVPPVEKIERTRHLPLPDKSAVFLEKFVDKEGNVMKTDVFKKRVLGLTSYFRSAQEKLLPRYDKNADFHVIECPMSDYQFGKYAEARRSERELEKNKKRNAAKKAAAAGAEELYEDVASTYRVMSRANCNFVFPEGIARPVPERAVAAATKGEVDAAAPAEMDEDDLDALTPEQRLDNVDGRYTEDDVEKLKEKGKKTDPTYLRRISRALEELKARGSSVLSEEGLMTYSPKFLNILENLRDPNHIGLHLLYTTFRTVEGIAIIKLMLEQNGFAEFRLHKSPDGSWDILEDDADVGKPRFALYTGTETAEEKEMLRNIYNGDFDNIPYALAEKVRAISSNNLYGEVIKLFMITAAGAEGINLKNTRYVHITEPYWHPVRIEQVIGRARRICSHAGLPEELRTVSVFLYLATFTEEQSTGDVDIELREHDRARDPKVKGPITTDEYLFEISNIKDRVNQQILRAVKETAMDCSLYNRKLSEGGENLVCFSYGAVKSNAFASYPTLEEDEAETTDVNVKRVEWTAIEVKIRGKKYAIRKDTGELYDYDEYKMAQKIGQVIFPIGKMNMDESGNVAGVEFYRGGGGGGGGETKE